MPHETTVQESPTPLRFTVDDYYRMADVGILDPQRTYELIDGRIYQMSPKTPPHSKATRVLTRLFLAAAGGRYTVSDQNPLRVSERSEPEPDVALLRFDPDDYGTRHPTPAETHLIVEVALSSLAFDRRRKLPVYAAAGIPEVWIVNLADGVIEVYRDPDGGEAYRSSDRAGRGRHVAPRAFPDVAIPVDAVLPPPTAQE